MNVTEALQARASIRAYKTEPVEGRLIAEILEVALRSPSWANSQPWEVFVVGGEPLERLREGSLERTRQGVKGGSELPAPTSWPDDAQARVDAMIAGRAQHAGVPRGDPADRQAFLENNRRFFGAPVVAYLCLDRALTAWSIYDVGAMSQSIMLAAQERRVDSTPAVNLVMFPDMIRAELDIPKRFMILMGIALGYRDPDDPRNTYRTERRTLKEAVRFVGLSV